MKKIIPLVLSFAVQCGAGQAQELVIRSGDHPTFSRLTVPLPVSQPWRAQQTANGVEVSFPEFKGSFDTSTVFLRMRQDRISRITKRGKTLILTIDCGCIASAFRAGELLVIDVADEGTSLAGPPIKGISTENKEVTIRRMRPVQKPLKSSLPWIGSNSPFIGSEVDSIVIADKSDDVIGDLVGQPANRAELLNDIQKTLVEEVATAASIGLLESNFSEPPVEIAATSSKVTLKPKALPIDIQVPSQNLRITNSMDKAHGHRDSALDATSIGLSCPGDDFLPVETWGTGDSFSAQIGPARNALSDARDRLDKNAAKHLAQTYLYFGFGAEALNTLQLDPSLMPELRHLANIAQILEQGSIIRPNTLSHFTDCASNVALWASLSFETIPKNAAVNIDAALRALNKLPSHLRQILAPELSKRLLQYGKPSAAATAMRSIDRLAGSPPPKVKMAQANLAINSGDPAEDFLKEVIETNSEQSPSALITLIESKIKNNEALFPETATLVEAYAHELRGTELGSQLRQTQVAAMSQSGRFSEAFDELTSISPSLSPDATQRLQAIVFDSVFQAADDVTFLKIILSKKKSELEKLPVEISLNIARRLLDLGFAVQAQERLSMIGESGRVPEKQVLSARAALLLLQPFQAQAALIGVDTAQADLLRAKAKEMAGAYSEASELFSNNDAPSEAMQAAWLSEDWRELIPPNNASFGAVASIEQKSENLSALGPLGHANRALEESSQARSALTSLLNDPTLQISSGF